MLKETGWGNGRGEERKKEGREGKQNGRMNCVIAKSCIR